VFFKLIIQTEFQPTEVKLIFRPPLLVNFRPSKFNLCEVLLVVLDFLVASSDAKSVRQIYAKMVQQDILLAIKVLMVIQLVIFLDEMQCLQNNEKEKLMI
jgi:hypothetical protein